jgi:glutamyl-tRNA reductase
VSNTAGALRETILVVGLSRETAPVHVRERASLDEAGARGLLRSLRATGDVDEAVALSTCNRTEVYAVVPAACGQAAPSIIREALYCQTSVAREELVQLGYVRFEEEAVEHLFGVVAGLNSTVLGEPEIVSQVRASVALAATEEMVGDLLRALFRQAAAAGRRVRGNTTISRGATSVSSVAVELAAALLDDLHGRRALVVGAGRVASAAAKRLADAGAREVVIANRSPRAGAALARRVGARSAPLTRLAEELAAADLVVCATGAPAPVVSRRVLEAATRGRKRCLVMLDLAMPRDVEPAAHDLPGVVLRDIDGIQQIAATHLDERRRELPQAWSIVRSEARRFAESRVSPAAEPVVRELRRRAEAVRRGELDRMIACSPQLTDSELARLDEVTRSLVKKLLHEPTRRIRQAGCSPEGRARLDALGEVFAAYG